ncbi:MAG: hypothetical protein NTW19_06450 [Planctomycetota bacterium]|nr:hypothetical protein [Planctomycetota bacterium]
MFTFGFAEPQQGVAIPADDDKVAVREEVTDVLTPLLPWGISFLFHAGVLLLMVFMVFATKNSGPKEGETGPIIPTATLSATPGGSLSRSEHASISSSSATSSRSAERATNRATGGSGGGQRTSALGATGGLIGVGGAASGGGDGSEGSGGGKGGGWTGGLSQGAGNGNGSPFGSGGAGGGGAFAAKFMGTGGNARKIIYLVDASGSLIDSLAFVILELKRSIGQLSEQQVFTVIFFQGDEAIEVPPPGLKKASLEKKGMVIDWMDPAKGNVTPMGLSNPVKALQAALRYKPELMFLLSDDITGKGRYEVDQRRLLAEIEQANTGHTKINTIQFLYADPLTQAKMRGTMELIAERSGGVFKFIDGRELGIE